MTVKEMVDELLKDNEFLKVTGVCLGLAYLHVKDRSEKETGLFDDDVIEAARKIANFIRKYEDYDVDEITKAVEQHKKIHL